MVRKFKIGDRVMVTHSGFSFADRVVNKMPGTVRKISDGGSRIGIVFDEPLYAYDVKPNSTAWWHDASEVVLLSDKQAHKPGDWVRIKPGALDYPSRGLRCGGVYQVTLVTASNSVYVRATEGDHAGEEYCFTEYEIEPASEPKPKPKSKSKSAPVQKASPVLPFNATINEAPAPPVPPPESVTITLPREDIAALARLFGAISCGDGDMVVKHPTNKDFTYEMWSNFERLCEALGCTHEQIYSDAGGLLVLR